MFACFIAIDIGNTYIFSKIADCYYPLKESIMPSLYTLLPNMNTLLTMLDATIDTSLYPRILIKDAITDYLTTIRNNIKNGLITTKEQLNEVIDNQTITQCVLKAIQPHFKRVLNGTGVVLHTNAGRAILSPHAVHAVLQACQYYSNLELNLETGERGSRYSHVESLLCKITGAEAALVVNNNAAAVLLILDTVCKNKEVITSRGQLVEIGGSFRIPDVMQKSGTILKEVGTTNRTHLHDYENAITENTAALMKIHTSNFKVSGFTHSVQLEELVLLGQRYNIPVIDDLGSGSLFSFTPYGLSDEPTVQQAVATGADIISFSGDKALGGPQAGIIVGKKCYIDKLKKNQLTRALRIDKMTLTALEATLRDYLTPETLPLNNPTIGMITIPLTSLRKKAELLLSYINDLKSNAIRTSIVEGFSKVGGGSFPEEILPTYVLRIKSLFDSAEECKRKLLQTSIPLLTRIEDNYIVIDVRTLNNEEFPLVAQMLKEILPQYYPSHDIS